MVGSMKNAIDNIRERFALGASVEDRVEVKRKSRPNRKLHRKQLRSMIKWDQHPVVAYK